MAEENKQFRKDVLKAKAKYRKRRRFIILSVMTFALVITLIQTFLYTREKKQVNTQLADQNQKIENLEKENKVNELVIDKLKDPYFITDLVRQEYGLSYQGEIIFNLPLQESFLQTTIKAIMEGDLQKKEEDKPKIDDSKIPELAKKDSTDKTKRENDNNESVVNERANGESNSNDSNRASNAEDNDDTETATSNQNSRSRNSNTTNRRSNRG